jgi:hypothetical protein
LLHRLLQASSLGPIADCALHRPASQSGAFSLPVCTLVHYCSSCVVVVRFIHHALLRALILSVLASSATDLANHHQWITHESSMTISRCQSPIVH